MRKLILAIPCLAAAGFCLGMFAAAPAAGATFFTNAAWTWMKGATNADQNGVCGTQGVTAPANMPGGTYGFWFAVDYPMNGIMNGNAMLYDNVTVVVR